jgi:Response regulator containing CheY-like receiver, AAA-type ATPase, and DNA-binding domains
MLNDLPGFPHPLVGQSPRIQQVFRQIEKLGRTRWPVLILGETGTGKEVVARAIHNVQATGPFVTIDCSSLVGPLMESELFGHTKGAFTGANNAKLGLIELAHGGIAFLDEIGELPLDMQAKLLRVLQEKEFRPVGSLAQRRSDFRVVAATNRDLASEVEKGNFRRDLYYRLNVVTLRLAPLRERREDIQALLTHFIAKYGRGHSLAEEAVNVLVAYNWPGNVRELENCIQHMVAIHSGPILYTADLPSPLRNAHAMQSGLAAMSTAVNQGAVKFEPSLCEVIPLPEVEKRAILGALRYTKGDRATAASLLGIGRTTLYRKLKEYNLEP